ncbi:hypothetical protein EW093_12110 [Thiospirochaeta perfilievii]|uniref:PilZ domain-containing protein n=1 Tax=Thiospirochaeta perfilievii TaxID=252967 RepID=A0A5C1QFQ9_9SPIO|nr:hypothetical protein [Thiospirochaeta perfilievii]QEN05424.1 hypothetical protein EW093_12110 [Thiospirochaeta perfilievii]
MISAIGKKIFFINPPDSLKNCYLDTIFKKEFEIYLLHSVDNMERLLEIFKDVIVFINIDEVLDRNQWLDYISALKKNHRHVIVGVFTKNPSSSLQKSYLMDIGILGGFIHLQEDNWKTINLILKVLEANEARGRRKTVRLDFNSNDARSNLGVKVYTQSGLLLVGFIQSVSSAGILISLNKKHIGESDNVDYVRFSLNDTELYIKGYLLKRFDNGNYFISFEEIGEEDKELVQSYIFDSLQKGFEQLLKSL